MILDDITAAIGDTPLLRLQRFAPDAPAELLAKLELFNPYSIKDRPVLFMIRAAEESGELAPGGTIVEATSGNTGMAAAMIASVRGYRCILVMSEIQSLERRQVLRALGATLVLTPKEGGTKAAREKARALAVETGAFYLGQHDHPANPISHAETTAEELWTATEGRIDVLVAGLGTAGTLVGVARALKPRKPGFQVIGVEPDTAPFISQGIFRPHRIMGTAPGFVPGVLERDQIDAIELVSEEEAFAACRRIARTEGLLVGITSGATAAVAARLAKRPEMAGRTIVCVFCDSGQRYLSVAGLFEGSAETDPPV
jgi:cysteine synthase A